MAKITQKTSKRFGPRYGRTLKAKLNTVETLAKSKYKCPYCSKTQVKKEQAGIWTCKSCKKTFAGRSYQP
ncbi:50S ribosomal protein L37ae [Candidatus Woesearchaeota archaeon]|nr:50S ribosomal protein L37ae [Candidatus Woesearchaeota archaeon]